jgi:hypothetical protein
MRQVGPAEILKHYKFKEDYWAIWLGMLTLDAGLVFFLPRPPANMQAVVEEANAMMKANVSAYNRFFPLLIPGLALAMLFGIGNNVMGRAWGVLCWVSALSICWPSWQIWQRRSKP